jgi:ADP-ribose pyrophosphatase YjhB (NUDIX family)
MRSQKTMGTWFVCAKCDWEGEVKCGSGEPHNLIYGPKLTVDAIIEYHGHIILIQRTKRDGKPTGEWAFPGGYVEFRERLLDAIVRETKEETGLDILNVQLFGIYDDPERDKAYNRNNVSVVYKALACGEIKVPDDGEVAAIRGLTIEEIRSRRFGISPIVATGVFLNLSFAHFTYNMLNSV